MKNDMVVFVVEGYNRYSIAALAGILDQELPELPVTFAQSRVLPEQIEELARQHRRVVLAFSFMSPQLPQLLPILVELRARPENVMFNMVQGHRFTVERHDLFLPGPGVEYAKLFNGLDARIFRQDQFYGPGVVDIDIKGILLCA